MGAGFLPPSSFVSSPSLPPFYGGSTPSHILKIIWKERAEGEKENK